MKIWACLDYILDTMQLLIQYGLEELAKREERARERALLLFPSFDLSDAHCYEFALLYLLDFIL